MCGESPSFSAVRILRRDDAEHRAAALAIGEDVRAEAREALDLVGEVGVVPLGKLLPVGRRHDRDRAAAARYSSVSAGMSGSSGCMRPSLRTSGGDADAQVQVGRAGLAHRVEQLSIDGRLR